ncbi:MAG: TonB-dependent receptor [Rikenellaceae bacterium]
MTKIFTVPDGFSRRLRTTLKSLSLVVTLLAMATSLSAQSAETPISLDIERGTLKMAVEEIKSQSDYSFTIDSDAVNLNQRLSIKVDKASIQETMDKISALSNIDYSIDQSRIYLKAQQPKAPRGNTITGLVKDSNGEPMIGANVVIKGTYTGTVTDVDGKFTMVCDNGATLQISNLGYNPLEVTVSDRRTYLELTMQESTAMLDEVVVVGYGTQRKVNLTGAVAVVDQSQFESRPAPRASQMLQGAVPNVNITYGSGQPTSSASINIRGVNSISGSATPLVLIDGVEGNIDRINPNDIESISVLKDASSAAIYGARAAYGVVLVTTKKGSEKKTVVTYEGRYSVSTPTTSTDYETRGYYSAKIADMFYSTYQGKSYTQYTDEDYYQLWLRRNDETENSDRPWVVTDLRDGQDTYVYYANTDWYHYLYNDINTMWEHNVSVSGGNDKTSYYISGNATSKEGIFRINPDTYNAYNLRSKITSKVTDRLTITNNTSYHNRTYTYPGYSGVDNTFTNAINHALACFSPTNPDGTAVYFTSLNGNQGLLDGRGAMLEYDGHTNTDRVSEFSTIFDANFQILENLSLKANYNYIQTVAQNTNRSTNIPYSQYPGVISYITSGIGENSLSESTGIDNYHAINVFGDYSFKSGGHSATFMAGANYEHKTYKDFSVSRDGLLSDELNDLDLAVGENYEVSGGQNEYALVGIFYRANYDYEGRYLFETSGRYDGSSRFMSGHRFGFFPSASAGWRISEEPFFDLLRESVDNLKLRLSYGSLGNQQVGYYDYIQTVNTGNTLSYSFGDDTYASSATVSDPNAADLTWETVITYNVGVDISALDNRLTFTGDAYIRDTKGMQTLGTELPDTYGAAEPTMNAADLRTKGWELSIAWRDSFTLAGRPFEYNVTLGLADNTSKITKFDNPDKVIGSYYEGQQLGEIWGFKTDGLFATDELAASYEVDQSAVNSIINVSVVDTGLHAGDLKFVDLDGDNVISFGSGTVDDPGDRVVVGNSLPRYTYSAQFGASWCGVDFSIFLQGVGQQYWYPGYNCVSFWGPYSRPYTAFVADDFLSDVWSVDNPDAYFPRPRGYVALSSSENRELSAVNDRYIQNVAYCRVKNITVGYTFPDALVAPLKITNARVYFSGENLFTLTSLYSDYIDPEQASASNSISNATSNASTYPWQKTFSVGLSLNF